LVAFLGAAVRRPARFAALLLLLLRTSPEYLSLTDSAAGHAIGAYFNGRSRRLLPQNRFCQGVLILPSDHAAYLRGRRRQAVRTNLRNASDAGITCDVLDDRRRALDDLQAVFDHRRVPIDPANDWRSWVGGPETTYLVARDRRSRPLAAAAVVIDDSVCLIKLAVASDHLARWALHDHLIRLLIARGVRYVVAAGGGPFGALGLAPGVQHYQHLLGYELRHLIAQSERRLTRRQRLVTSGVLAAATVSLLIAADAAGTPPI
jgi:hypothetical protein